MKTRIRHAIWIISILALLPILISVLKPTPSFEFDLFLHLERMSVFYRQLAEGRFPPSWDTHFAYGFGSPVLLFNWSLPYYVISIFHALGTSLLQSFNLTTALFYVGTFIFMFQFLCTFLSPMAALVGAVWYIWAPYHFNIVFLRGAIGESGAMMMWPAVCWASRSAFHKRYMLSLFGGAIFWAALIFSHQGLFLMIMPLWILLIAVDYKRTNNFRALQVNFFALMLGLGSMSFFWIPAFLERTYVGYHYQETIYVKNFIPWIQLLSQPKLMEFGQHFGRLFYSIGWPLIGVLIVNVGLVISYRQRAVRTQLFEYQVLFGSIALIAIMLTRPISTVLWDHIPLLASVGYPQRFLSLMTFCVCTLAAILTQYITRRSTWIPMFIMVSLIIVCDIPFLTLNTTPNNNPVSSFLTLDTTDVWGEFMPKDIPKDFNRENRLIFDTYAKQPMLTVTPPGTSLPTCIQMSTSVTCTINSVMKSRVRFRQFFFPGWRAFADLKPVPITKNSDGTISVKLPKPAASVRIEFTHTPVRKFTALLSLVFISVYMYLFFKTIYTRTI